MRRFIWSCFICALTLAGGCAKSNDAGTQASPAPSPAASGTVAPESPVASATTGAPDQSAAAVASPLASSAPSPSPSPTPTATPNPNLLSWQNGAIVRTYPATAGNQPNDFVTRGLSMPTGSDQPYVVVYELPGAAQLTTISADLPGSGSDGKTSSVTFAAAVDGPTAPFHDLGTLGGDANEATKTMTVSAPGRWIRITNSGPAFYGVSVTGTLAPRPAAAQVAGTFVESDAPYAAGASLDHALDKDPWYRRLSVLGDALSGARCFDGHEGAGYPGTFDGRTWTFADGSNAGRLVVNDEGTLAIGTDAGSPLYLLRVSTQPKYCAARTSGSGPHRVLVLDGRDVQVLWPVDQNALPGYSATRIHASMLDRAALDGADVVVMNQLCDASRYLAKAQADALLQWVGAGHKLLIVDADACSPSSTYAFLPYPFVSSNPGARGAAGSRLIIVESDALGAADKSDAHFFDPATFLNRGANQLGDANIVTTQDPHWCGHLFGTNVLNDNGFMQMYAPYGQGIIIYDGFDDDDSNNPGYERVRTLEFQLPVPAGMPCSQSVASSFIVQPAAEATFVTGKAKRLTFAMEALATLGWKGHVNVSAAGPFASTVAPGSFDLSGTTRPLRITVNVPASARAGVSTIVVTGTDGWGHRSQATIALTATAPLVKKVKKHDRIRVYGIHFDVDSARIQPQSEKIVKEIGDLMRANPTIRFQVEGHTDSDGGPAYNRGLSQRRAQSVVDDLVTHYGIARRRMTPRGYGLTRPVAPNTTAANKALNRRVELLAL